MQNHSVCHKKSAPVPLNARGPGFADLFKP